MEWGYVQDNPATRVRISAQYVQRERTALNPEQIRLLTDALPEPCKSMALIAVLTGLRRGELFALRWGAIDFERKLISVRESVYEGQFNVPKTRSSVRKIAMAEGLEAILFRLREKNATASDLVFVSQKGPYYVPRIFSSGSFIRFVKGSGFRRWVARFASYERDSIARA